MTVTYFKMSRRRHLSIIKSSCCNFEVRLWALKRFTASSADSCYSIFVRKPFCTFLSPLLSPDVEGLRCLHYIQSLRREAHQALNEHVKLIHREDTTRFAKLLIALSMLRAISPLVVAQLFFRPVIGTVNIEEVLMEMFYGK